MKKFFLSIITIIASLLIISCAKPDPKNGVRRGPPPAERIYLNDKLSWTETTADEPIGAVLSDPTRFKKLDDTSNMNLYRLMGKKEGYAIVKADFVVPESFRGKPLGCLISYIHFAEIAFVNGFMVGRTGMFEPRPISSFYVSHQYPVPESLIRYGDNNTMFFKVYCRGRSAFAGKMFISEMRDVSITGNYLDFRNSLMYVAFTGLLFTMFIIFMIFFLARRERKENFSFAMLNLFSCTLSSYLFSGSLPLYEFLHLDYDTYLRVFLCISVCVIVYFFVSFNFHFLGIRENRGSKSIRGLILVGEAVLIMMIPTYSELMKITGFIFGIFGVNTLYALVIIINSLRNPEKKHNARLLMFGIFPLYISLVIDYILRHNMRIPDIPYITMFGWIVEIILFIIVLAVRFERTTKKNEYLTSQLQDEVDRQTKNLTIANENLAKEIFRANQDLEMAAIVQRKYFPAPNKKFRGWDVAISYNPLSNVSGDLYDYYSKEGNLNGISLFDVSGHGLSASLVTMLAKNIIASSFERGVKRGRTVSDMLLSINSRLNDEKGTIDNYLTGLLFRFIYNDDDTCAVQFANAGHPHPILYSAKSKKVKPVKYEGDKKHYGAIGIQGIDVSFPTTDFSMSDGDILLLYTDGLTESQNENLEPFGIERVEHVLSKNAKKPAVQIMDSLMYELEAFTDGVPKSDDVSVIIMKKEPSSLYVDSEETLDNIELEELVPVEVN